MKKLSAGLPAVAVIAVVFAAPAAAHVKVSGTDVSQGHYGALTFWVPTESDTASTVELKVSLPDDTPIAWVSTQPKPGWTATVRKTQYVSEIDWKANDLAAGIPSGQFDQFTITAGPLPKQPSAIFPVTQIYSDGKAVDWNEQSADGKTEPEHPAPTLKLPADTDVSAAKTESTPPSWPAWVGFGTGIAALAVSIAAAVAVVSRKQKTPGR